MAEPCCGQIIADIESTLPKYQQAYLEFWRVFNKPIRDFNKTPPGAFITLSSTTPEVPVLEEVLQRLQSPLDTGFGRWEWYNQAQNGITTLTLPQAPSKAKVVLNGAKLSSPRDYSIAGTTLTFVEGLELRDHVILKSYGA